MIGGIDVPMAREVGDLSLEVAVCAIRRALSGAVFENGLAGERHDHSREIPLGEIEEVFVCRDRASAEIWEAEGAIPEAFNTMIHLIADEGWITAVADERTAEIEEVLSAIRRGLADDLLRRLPSRAKG